MSLNYLCAERFLQEVQKGFDEIAQGKLVPAEEVFARMDELVDRIERGEDR